MTDETKPLGRLAIHAKSTNNEHATPREFYNRLNSEFGFSLDPAATRENALCEKFFTQEDDGLAQSWAGERVFCNPPYGRGLGRWVQKACEETNDVGTCELVVLLIPARPDTKYWHSYILHTPEGANFGYVDHRWIEVRFLKGRLKFGDQKNSAPFPSALIIYRGGHGLLADKPERDVDTEKGKERS